MMISLSRNRRLFAYLYMPLVFAAMSGFGLRAQAVKDPAAIEAINTALASMGGKPAIAAIQDAIVTAQISSPDGGPGATQVTWKSIRMSLRTEITGSNQSTISTVREGVGCIQTAGGTVSSMDQRLARSIFPHHLPGAVLLYLLNAPDRTLAIISDGDAGQNVVHFQSFQVLDDQSTLPETRQDWYIDMSTGLPTRVDYIIPAESGSDANGSVRFTSWQKMPSILIPHTIEDEQGSLVITSAMFNQGLVDTIFTLP